MGAMKDLVNVDLTELSGVVTVDETAEETPTAENEQTPAESTAPVKAQAKQRSKKYVAARSRVDRTNSYPLEDAVNLIKQTSYSKFDGTVTAHLNLTREINPVEVTFPHTTGKKLRVAVVDDEVLANIAEENIDFDVLLATPAMMPKLAKHARFLGPRGLMPNPKNGTVTNDPSAKKSSLEAGSTILRPEKKSNLMHVRIGKVSQAETELVANVQTLVKAVSPTNIEKLTLAATMSPGIKVQL